MIALFELLLLAVLWPILWPLIRLLVGSLRLAMFVGIAAFCFWDLLR